MKKLISCVLAAAALCAAKTGHTADMAVTRSPPLALPVAPAYNWAGHAGPAWSEQDYQTADQVLAPFTPFGRGSVIGGTFAGAEAGYNWQYGPWVFGPELSGSWADIRGSARCGVATFICTTKDDWFGSVTGRLGYADGRLLYYAKGGAAVIRDDLQLTSPFSSNVFNGDKTRWGPTVGAGVEYAFRPWLSGFIEYDYANFGTTAIATNDQFGLASNITTHQNLQMVKLGLNYHPWRTGSFDVQPQASGSFLKAPPAPIWSDWTLEAGARYWLSWGKMQKDLYDPFVTSQLNSRLTYGPQTGNSLEGFARFDHSSGLFVKGFIGFGVLGDGNLKDEDFPPALVPYSATNSSMNGRIDYAAADIGHVLFKGDTWNVGPFVGYRQYYQVSNGFGCAQTAGNPSICVPTIPQGFLGLTETQDYRGVAVGLNGSVMLTDRIKFAADLAYLPYVSLSAFDNHWFRADINPETGHGWGTQLEGILSYAVTDRWSVGVGGRYWYFKTTDAETEFPGIAPLSPEKFHAERYGVFLQTSYKFDGSDLAEPRAAVATGMPLKAPPEPIAVAAVNWTGLYIGANAGGGWGTNDWNNATGVPLALTGPNFPGSADVNGLIGGGQIGYNYQWGSWVFGVQADADAADIVGTAKCATFVGMGPTGGTCQNRGSALGSVTGRVGESVGKFLLYTDGGAAWARDNSSITSLTVGPLAFFGNDTRWGWTIGGGLAYALTPDWSVFGEYDYYALGSKGETLTDAVFGQSVVNIDEKLHLMKVGVNYKFY